MADEKLNIVIWQENLCASEKANFYQPLCFQKAASWIFLLQKKFHSNKSRSKQQIWYYKDFRSYAGLFRHQQISSIKSCYTQCPLSPLTIRWAKIPVRLRYQIYLTYSQRHIVNEFYRLSSSVQVEYWW